MHLSVKKGHSREKVRWEKVGDNNKCDFAPFKVMRALNWQTNLIRDCTCIFYVIVHSKNTRVSVTRKRVTRKRVHWGQTPFRVNDDPEISQLDAKYDPELGQSDPIICQFDWFPGHRWPGMEFGPNGPFFRVTADPCVFRVYIYVFIMYSRDPRETSLLLSGPLWLNILNERRKKDKIEYWS